MSLSLRDIYRSIYEKNKLLKCECCSVSLRYTPSAPRTAVLISSAAEKVGYWQLTARAPSRNSLTILLLSFPNRYWSQEQHTINFLHTNLCLRVCLPRKPTSNDVNNKNKVKIIESVFQGIWQEFHVGFSSFLIFFTETGTTKRRAFKPNFSPTRLVAKLTTVQGASRTHKESEEGKGLMWMWDLEWDLIPRTYRLQGGAIKWGSGFWGVPGNFLNDVRVHTAANA